MEAFFSNCEPHTDVEFHDFKSEGGKQNDDDKIKKKKLQIKWKFINIFNASAATKAWNPMNLNKNDFSVCADTGGEYLKTLTNVLSMLNTK